MATAAGAKALALRSEVHRKKGLLLNLALKQRPVWGHSYGAEHILTIRDAYMYMCTYIRLYTYIYIYIAIDR